MITAEEARKMMPIKNVEDIEAMKKDIDEGILAQISFNSSQIVKEVTSIDKNLVIMVKQEYEKLGYIVDYAEYDFEKKKFLTISWEKKEIEIKEEKKDNNEKIVL